MRTVCQQFEGDAISTSVPGKAAAQLAEYIDLTSLNRQCHQAEKHLLEGSSTADTIHPVSCVIRVTWAHQHRRCPSVADLMRQGANRVDAVMLLTQ